MDDYSYYFDRQHKSMELQVEGMTCTNCAASVERYLERKGFKHVVVDYASGMVQFSETDGMPMEEVIAGINKLGFRVVEAEKPGPWFTLERKFLISLIFTLPLLSGHMLMVAGLSVPWLEAPLIQFAFAFPVYLIGFFHFGKSAWASVRSGVPNMDVLIFMGSTAAFGYSLAGWYQGNAHAIFFETSATIFTLVLLGNLLEHRAVKKTTTAIEELSRLQPTKAHKVMPSGAIVTVEYKDLSSGDVLQVNEGDTVPADGKILHGNALIDESMLTGESLPVDKKKGELVIGGALVSGGHFRMVVTALGADATLGKMIELVKAARQEKPSLQRLADRVSAIFVPLVIGISFLTFVISFFAVQIPLSTALMNSIAVLVISCPCALGLATPTAVTVGVGRLAKNGILIKGARTIEQFSSIRNIVFDKTGTLTTGQFKLKNINYNGIEPAIANAIIVQLEQHSSHPLAKSLVKALKTEGQSDELVNLYDIQEMKGVGMQARTADGTAVNLGSWRMVEVPASLASADLFLTLGGKVVATIEVADELREGAVELMAFLRQKHYEPIILSGDNESKTKEVAEQLGVTSYAANQRPEEKLARIAALSASAPTAMLGDGINDAPALTRADLGISISGGTQAAIRSSQVILLNGQLQQLKNAVNISKATLQTIKQNLFWAFAYNVIAIPIAAAGFLNPMWAAFFMAFSDVIVIGNSLRLRSKKIKS